MKEPFLVALKQHRFVTQACEAVGVPRNSVYEWRERDEKFRRDMDAVDAGLVDILRQEAFKRAVDGEDKPITVAGQREVIKEKSDALLTTLLRAKDPAFREGATVQINISFVQMLVGKLQDIVQRVVPVKCPHCDKQLETRSKLSTEFSHLDAIDVNPEPTAHA